MVLLHAWAFFFLRNIHIYYKYSLEVQSIPNKLCLSFWTVLVLCVSAIHIRLSWVFCLFRCNSYFSMTALFFCSTNKKIYCNVNVAVLTYLYAFLVHICGVQLGAGTSLPGLVAAKLGADVTLTDIAHNGEVSSTPSWLDLLLVFNITCWWLNTYSFPLSLAMSRYWTIYGKYAVWIMWTVRYALIWSYLLQVASFENSFTFYK